MSAVDRYISFSNSSLGKLLTSAIGLPQPVPLVRAEDGKTDLRGPVLIGSTNGGRLYSVLAKTLKTVDAMTYYFEANKDWRPVADQHGLKVMQFDPEIGGRVGGLVFDATTLSTTEELNSLYDFFHNSLRSLGSCGRVLILGTLPDASETAEQAILQRALEGFTRSLGKEMRKGGTVQLVYVSPGAEDALESTVRFFLSPRAAYVSGQVVRVGMPGAAAPEFDVSKPFTGRNVLITGASRGIGAAIAENFARDGAHVVGVDITQAEAELAALTKKLGGSDIPLDITLPHAAEVLIADAKARGGYDVVVHNAGVTRDKKLVNMDQKRWDSVMDVNLTAPLRLTEALLSENAINSNGRVVCLSSVSGIAGNVGQTNYGLSKAGVIGLVEQLAPVLSDGITINAVAPGFIETKMTAAIPFAVREVARRLNSMSQGGLPVDVAETISWLANPGSGGVNGSVVRVCGQSMIGA